MPGDLSKDFYSYEARCKCGRNVCKAINVHPMLIHGLQTERDIIMIPITVNCICRCLYWNNYWDGSPTSKHLTTLQKPSCAADIFCKNQEWDVWTLASVALSIDCFRSSGIGIYPDRKTPLIHLDVGRSSSVRWIEEIKGEKKKNIYYDSFDFGEQIANHSK